MPLDSIEAYEQLGEHLTALDPQLDAWAEPRGFKRFLNTGRYPERRFYRDNSTPRVFLSIFLQRTDSGKRFDQFRPDLPYGGVLGFVLPHPSRRSRRVLLFHHVPFEKLLCDFSNLMEPATEYLQKIGMDDLYVPEDDYSLFFFDHETQTGAFTNGYQWM